MKYMFNKYYTYNILYINGKFLYMDHHFILLWLNPFKIRVDEERWWFERFMS